MAFALSCVHEDPDLLGLDSALEAATNGFSGDTPSSISMLCMLGLGPGRLWLRTPLGTSAEADLDLDAGGFFDYYKLPPAAGQNSQQR